MLRRLLFKMASNQLRLLCQTRTSNLASLLSPLLNRYSCYRVAPHGLIQRHFSHKSAAVSKIYVARNEPGSSHSFRRVSTSRGDLETLYRLRWIKHLRFISRVKILHVAVVTALTWPISYWYTRGLVSTTGLAASIVAATATTVGLFVLSYFFRRIVGQIDVNKSNETVIISTLTFWGNRRNKVFSLSDVVPLSESGFEPKHVFHRLELYNSSYVYLCSLRYGEIYDQESFFKVIGLWLDSSNRSQEKVKKIKVDTNPEECTHSNETS